MAVRLTETAIRRAIREASTTGRRDLSDVVAPGLRLRLTPTGRASWVLACRDGHGRMRRFPVGAWPTIGIGEARDKARALRVRVREEGADPIAERRRLRAMGRDAQEGIGTLAALLNVYGGPSAPVAASASGVINGGRRVIGPGKELRSWRSEQRPKIERVFGADLRRPLASLTAGDLQMAADAYPAASSGSAAVRYLRPVLKWAAKRGYVARDLALIEPPATVKRRTRILSREELARILPVLSGPNASAQRRALAFMLMTLCRRDEAASARWRDVDLEVAEWRIPETKSGEPHRVPLPRQAVALLRSMDPGPRDALIFASRRGAKLSNWDRETKRIMAETGTAGWTRHDLRRTGATQLGELGFEPHVIEAALNHAAIHSRLASTYNRARYQPAVREALQRLADWLDMLATGVAGNVRAFQRTAS
jgi:integrase